MFGKAIEQACLKIQSEAHSNKNLIWIDKNFLPNKLPEIVLQVRNALSKDFQPVFMYLIPETKAGDMIKDWPFSEDFLLNRFANVFVPEERSIAKTEPSKIYHIMLGFLENYKHCKFDECFLKENCVDSFLKVPIKYTH